MKKGLSIVMILIIALSLMTGCQKAEKTILDTIKEKGVLTIGTSADYPPYEFHAEIDGKDTVVGFDIDIAQAIADDLGVKLEIKEMSFDGLLAGLKSGKVDMVIAGMTPTEERAKEFNFSKIYYQAQHTVIVKADAVAPTTWEELNGKIIGVQKATVQVDVAKEKIPTAAEYKELSKIPDLILLLKSGKADALVVEQPVALAYVKNNPDIVLANLSATDENGGSAVAINKGEDAFLAEINKVLDSLIAKDQINVFFNKATEIAATLNE